MCQQACEVACLLAGFLCRGKSILAAWCQSIFHILPHISWLVHENLQLHSANPHWCLVERVEIKPLCVSASGQLVIVMAYGGEEGL